MLKVEKEINDFASTHKELLKYWNYEKNIDVNPENIIADIFTKLGKKLYYFEYNSTLEVDFIIRYEDVLTAVEVKSADNTKSKSLKSLMDNWNVIKGIKLSSKNIGYKDNVISYPIYMVMFL